MDYALSQNRHSLIRELFYVQVCDNHNKQTPVNTSLPGNPEESGCELASKTSITQRLQNENLHKRHKEL